MNPNLHGEKIKSHTILNFFVIISQKPEAPNQSINQSEIFMLNYSLA